MNDSDTDANVKAIDLLNYETVKYFVAEEREARRYDRSMARYEDASVRAYVSLAVLNAGQARSSPLGRGRRGDVRHGHQAGTNTVGDLVMINAMMIQLYQPLNFMGMVYREIKQAVIDIETMFTISRASPRSRTSRRPSCSRSSAAPSASRTSPSPTSPIGKFSRGSHSMSRPAIVAVVALRGPAVDDLKVCCSASMR